MAYPPGTRIGPYEIVDLLGGGGMGDVYRAKDVRLGRLIALKVIRASLLRVVDVQRFALEQRATSAITHPHIVALFDVGEHEGAPYLVTELLQGETLRDRMSRGRIPIAKVIEYARMIASGIAAAHEQGIIHRDLKPENVFITTDGHLKVLDFGLAKVTMPGADDGMTQLAALTSAGMVVGTVNYMSPEQVRGGELDSRSDIFSLGAILYEMIAGRVAFREHTAVETMNAILNREAPPLDALAAPAPLLVVVRQCLEKNPRDRFQSARDLELTLGAMGTGTAMMPAVSAGPPRRRWILPAAIAAVSTVVVAAGTWFAFGRPAGAGGGPDYRQLTFRRGFLTAARLTTDGHTVVYSGAWEGAPLQAFSMRLESPEARPLDVSAAAVLAISSTGELAMELNGRPLARLLGVGTLARVPIMGGTPREIMKDVVQADWSPDGVSLAVIRWVNNTYRLEYPIGTVLYENRGGLADLRISRDGQSVAFTEHPALPDDRGDICVIGRDGVKRVVSPGWASVSGLAWSPRGDEIWFSAAEVGANASLWAVAPGGERRLLDKSLGRKMVLDVAADGQALVAEGRLRFLLAFRDGPQSADRMLSWLDASIASDISADGHTLVFDEQGEGSRSRGYSIYLRKSDGAAAVRLGDGFAGSLSPDTTRVAAIATSTPPSLTILTTGAGEAVSMARGSLVGYSAVAWMPDGESVAFTGHEQGRPSRVYVQAVKNGAPRPVSPEGYRFPPYTSPVSPDGKTMIALDPSDKLVKISIADGAMRALEGAEAGDTVMRWAADGQSVFVARKSDRPASISRLAAEGGRRELLLSLTPTDHAGYTTLLTAQITPDGKRLAYSFGQNLMDLYLVRGLQ